MSERRQNVRPVRAWDEGSRAYVLQRLAEAWERCPELRLCQLVVNATGTNDPFYVEDIPLADALDEYPPEMRQ